MVVSVHFNCYLIIYYNFFSLCLIYLLIVAHCLYKLELLFDCISDCHWFYIALYYSLKKGKSLLLINQLTGLCVPDTEITCQSKDSS